MVGGKEKVFVRRIRKAGENINVRME